MTKSKREDKIFETMYIMIKNGDSFEWKEIVEKISEKLEIKNWLEVRGVLQWFISEGKIIRDEDLFKEKYIVLIEKV